MGVGALGRRGALVAVSCVALCWARPARAATYAVGPGRALRDLQAVARLLRPGDRVEVDGDATYPGGLVLRESGTALAPITILGKRVHGRRPVIAGGSTTIEFRGSHYRFEGFEVTGGSSRCLFHHGDDLIVRDAQIHDCEHHGVLGADTDSGSLTLSYVEIFRTGRGDSAHQIYVATDELAHPGSVFRMEHCFIHDGNGGNNVKSRAERNELYANWIEGALYHEVELIGPDGKERKRRREDSDVVGNVIKKTRPGYAIRVGGDGSGETLGRYRFVNNTIVLNPSVRAAFRLFNGLESIEMHNNAMLCDGGGPVRVMVEDDVRWAAGRPVIAGTNNWLPDGSSGVPAQWKRTLFGADPKLVSRRDLRPALGSPLIDAGDRALAAIPSFEFPSPLAAPLDLPPRAELEPVGEARPRLRGCADIGAFQFEPPPGGAPAPTTRGACGCRSGDAPAPSIFGLAALAPALALLRRRRRAPR